METFWTIFGYLLFGFICLIFLMLLLAIILEGLGRVLHILYMLILFCISIPLFLFNPKQFMEGYRLGKKHPYVDLETAQFLEKHSRRKRI